MDNYTCSSFQLISDMPMVVDKHLIFLSNGEECGVEDGDDEANYGAMKSRRSSTSQFVMNQVSYIRGSSMTVEYQV